MQTMTAASVSRATLWIGWILSGLLVVFMTFDGTIQLIAFDFVTSGMADFGIPGEFARPLCLATLVCTALYAVPRTAVLGAILLTGFLGGTIATHLRGADPLLPHIIAALVLGLFVWGGLYLRDGRLRTLIPLRQD